MEQYAQRRAPNVSQYIANLNTIPSANDMFQDDMQNFDDDLALFKDSQFFDFDLNANDPNFDRRSQPTSSPPNGMMPGGFYQFPQFVPAPPSSAGYNSLPPSPPNGLPASGQIQQSQPTVPSFAHFGAIEHQGQGSATVPKRRETTTSTAELEEQSRMVAEEDKRRRNTAASARFRVKKKQREQALEKTAKEMSDRVQVLEARIGALEMENKWLKSLITEKGIESGKTLTNKAKAAQEAAADKAVKVEVADSTKQHNDIDVEAEKRHRADAEDDERSRLQKRRGVGTEEVAA